MAADQISVVHVKDVLMVTVPAEPDDSTIAELQERVLTSMQKYEARGLIVDISTVETMDSYFARTIAETSQMVHLMGGKTVIVGMRPSVAITTVQLGLSMGEVRTALNVDGAFDMLKSGEGGRGEGPA